MNQNESHSSSGRFVLGKVTFYVRAEYSTD